MPLPIIDVFYCQNPPDDNFLIIYASEKLFGYDNQGVFNAGFEILANATLIDCSDDNFSPYHVFLLTNYLNWSHSGTAQVYINRDEVFKQLISGQI